MIRKEFKDITRSSLFKLYYTILIVTCIRIFLWGINYFELITITFGLLIFWISIDYSTKMYKFEINDHSWEYLLTLPISRSRIIFIKLLPRLFNISILSAAYIVVFKIFFSDATMHDYDLVHPYFLIPLAYIIIISGAVIRISGTKDRILLSILEYAVIGAIGWFSYLYISSTYTRIFDEYPYWGSFLIGFLILTLVEFTLFLKFFKSFDMKTINTDGSQFTRFATPYLLILILASLLMIFFRMNNFL